MDAKIEAEAINLHAIIRAAEDWSLEYGKDPVTHAKLLRLEAKWELDLRRLFRKMAKESWKYINWSQYNTQLRADYNVQVIVNDDQIDNNDAEFIRVSFQTVTDLTTLGAVAGQTIYNIPLGISSTDANIQKLSVDHVASLVGKRVLPDGTIIDNPNKEFNILETIRNDIAQSIKISLGLGEDLQTAIDRVSKVIATPARAEKIARTESVNAYQAGLRMFAHASGAVGKEWLTVGAKDFCLDNQAAGPIPINATFPSGASEPTAHVYCRCGIRYIYKQEWDALEGSSDD